MSPTSYLTAPPRVEWTDEYTVDRPSSTTRFIGPTAADNKSTMTSAGTPRFQPRIEQLSGPAPYDPGNYFIVAFFGGVLALAVVSLKNLQRLGPRRHALKNQTLAVIGATIVGLLLFLILSPADWWSPARNIRIGAQVFAVIGSIAMTRIHKPAALSMSVRHGDHTSMWKAIGWILAAIAAQAVVLAIIGMARGTM